MAGVRRSPSKGRRRHRTSADPPRKTGWQVRASVVDAVREAVAKGAADSQNAFVERALVRELEELRRRRIYDAYARAAADPVFTDDMRSTGTAFDTAAGDGLPDVEG